MASVAMAGHDTQNLMLPCERPQQERETAAAYRKDFMQWPLKIAKAFHVK